MNKGDLIARIIDYKGKELCNLNAPEDGMIFGLRAMPNVTTGDWCCFYEIIEGFNKNKDDDSFRLKTKSYLGYMLLYNYEKEKNSDYVDKSMMLVIPLPMKEWIPTGDDWQEDSTSEP